MPSLLAVESSNKARRIFFFLKPYCSSQSGPGSLCSCILRDCQDELCYTNVSVVDYERRASGQSRSSRKVLLFFSQEFPLSDFTFHILHITYRNFRKTQTPQKPPNQSQTLQKLLSRKVLVAEISRQTALLMSTGQELLTRCSSVADCISGDSVTVVGGI